MTTDTDTTSKGSDRFVLTIVVVALLAMVAGALRLWTLGDWNFERDEVATLIEDAILFGDIKVQHQFVSLVAKDDQFQRLPRAAILSYGLHRVGYSLFGRDEFGSRVLPALFGVATVICVFFAARSAYGLPVALAASLSLAIWPEHLLFSQHNRMYAFGMFFVTLTYSAGYFLLRKPSVCSVVAFGLAGVGVILSNATALPALPIATLALLVGFVSMRQFPRPSVAIALIVWACVWAAVYFLYVAPIVANWNPSLRTGYERDVFRVAKYTIKCLEWPNLLLAGIGVFLWLAKRESQDWYWLIGCVGWAAYFVVVPYCVNCYQPRYSVSLSFPVFMAIGCAVGSVFSWMRARHGVAPAIGAFASLILLVLPSTISYYADGNRLQPRAAFDYISAHIQPGDRFVAQFPGHIIRFYMAAHLNQYRRVFPEGDRLVKLAEEEGSRLWIVTVSERGLQPEEMPEWLYAHCTHKRTFCAPRYDNKGFRTDVYLYKPPDVHLALSPRNQSP